MIIKFEENWCEHLTACPFRENVKVGDYDCCHCTFHKRIERNANEEFQNMSVGNYRRYHILAATGFVECKHPDNEEV